MTASGAPSVESVNVSSAARIWSEMVIVNALSAARTRTASWLRVKLGRSAGKGSAVPPAEEDG